MRTALTPERLWHMARIMGACALAFIGATLIGLTEIYWSLITAIVVTQPDLSKTLAASSDRIIATLVGAALGFLVLEASAEGAPKLLLFWAALTPLVVLTAIKPNLRMSGVTLVVVVLVPSVGEPFVRPFDRVVEILLGVIASVIVTAAIDYAGPSRRRQE
ncbi:MAG TPA: FUSC family protein [Roseiarcus sp.]|nr:FUSC family protein [Roseiarcus sp.]